MDALTNGVTIKVGNNTYHSFTDFGLAIGNNNYIEEPSYETNYVPVPGRDGFLDLSEAIAGRVIYKNRKISIEFGGMETEMSWDGVISNLRNLFHGKVVQLTFDNDPNWFWRGRAEINDFDRFRNLGTFKLEIPQAEPFKYSVPTGLTNLSATNTWTSITLPVTGLPVCPKFVVSGLADGATMRIRYLPGTTTYISLGNGTTRYPSMWLTETITVGYRTSTGTGTLSFVYENASL